jgi:regulator of protease activity HflC (stomatin/prohibitin superfamily)
MNPQRGVSQLWTATETMIRAVARQAEAEGVRRAKIIEADGEQQEVKEIAAPGAGMGDRR